MRHRHYIGIDIGGTKTNIGLIDETGQILISKKVTTQMPDEASIDAVKRIIETTKSLVDSMKPGNKVESIGIGVPGTVERKDGIVLLAPNLGWKNIPVKKLFQE